MPSKTQTTKTMDADDYESAPPLYDRPDYKTYCELVLGAMTREWQTIGDLKRALGLLYIDRWMQDALSTIGEHIEAKISVPERYRLKSEPARKAKEKNPFAATIF